MRTRTHVPFLLPSRSPSGWRFLAKALAWMALLYTLYFYPYADGSGPDRAIQVYLELQARASAWLIGLLDPGVTHSGVLIGGRFAMRVVKTCSSLDAQILYVATVLAFPAPLRARALGVVAGVLVLTGFNLLRIAGLYFVGAGAPGAFDAVHEELFPLLLVALACLSFVAWARWARPGPVADGG